MKKFILFILLITAALHYTNPAFKDHKRTIGATSLKSAAEADDPVWNDLAYMDFFVFSATQGVSKQALVSVGAFRFVTIIDSKWPYIKPKKKEKTY